MFISQQLKEKNIAAYLLYMWQVEDLIRANQYYIEEIKSRIIVPSQLSEEDKEKEIRWFEELIQMMQREGVLEKGHLQINKNVIT